MHLALISRNNDRVLHMTREIKTQRESEGESRKQMG